MSGVATRIGTINAVIVTAIASGISAVIASVIAAVCSLGTCLCGSARC